MSTRRLQALTGRTLSSVEFVQDYLQLRFDGPTLTVHSLLTVESGDSRVVGRTSPDWRNAICERIGAKVMRAESEPDSEITLEFADRWTFHISLRPPDRTGPEAAVLEEPGEPIVVCQ